MSDRDDAERIFCEALETPSAERANFLDLACGENADLRRSVERLLTENDALGNFLEAPIIDARIIGLEMPTAPLPFPFVQGRLSVATPLLNALGAVEWEKSTRPKMKSWVALSH